MDPDLNRSFDSGARLLARSAVVYVRHLPFIAAVTLAVFLPGKLLAQAGAAVFEIAPEGLASYFVMSVSDLALGSLAIPALIFGLTTGRPIGDCLRRGARLWRRMLWNKIKVEITVSLWLLLLFIPGLIAMVKLALVDAIVTLEEREADPLARSRKMTEGRRGRVALVVLPFLAIDLAGSYLVLGALPGVAHSRWMLALSDSALALIGMWSVVAGLMMYLEIGAGVNPAPAVQRPPRKAPSR